jgi:hypothetical protein
MPRWHHCTIVEALLIVVLWAVVLWLLVWRS